MPRVLGVDFRFRRGPKWFDPLLDAMAHRTIAFVLNGNGARHPPDRRHARGSRRLLDAAGHTGPEFVEFAHRRTIASVGLRSSQLAHADLSDRNLALVVLNDADLSRAHLAGSDLSNAKLLRANLESAELQGARLRGADLRHANLSAARMVAADLSVAVCRQADFRGADLRQARLVGTDLTGADLTDAQLPSDLDRSRCKFDATTRWPG